MMEHRQPVTMVGRGRTTVLEDLPEWIVVEEILIRLPPKDLLRCRAVRKCWHSATSTDKFILDHHYRQPSLPILSHLVDQQNDLLFVPRDADAGQQRLCRVLRASKCGVLRAALDGLLIVAHGPEFFICNPVTRKCAPLREPPSRQGFYHNIGGFYRHQPSGEYRLLWRSSPTYYNAYDINCRTSYYVMVLGSANSRCIKQGCVPRLVVLSPPLELVLRDGMPGYPPVHHRRNLHWKLGKYDGLDGGYILVFNTTIETFQLMRRTDKSHPLDLWLLEMYGTLALCRLSSDRDTIDIWVIQDYDAETWSLKNRINLSGVDPFRHANPKVMIPMMVMLNEGELLIQFTSRHVSRYGIDGKFLGYVKHEEDKEFKLWITKYYLQESVFSLPLFHDVRDENGVTQEPPFFVGL